MFDRRGFLLATAAAALLPAAAWAHHGWAWTSGQNFVLSGVLRDARLGNPHGLLRVEADAVLWTAEIGQPWRNAQAGLTDAMFVPGLELTLEGQRSTDPAEPRMKAERVIIAGKLYNLYPERS